MRKFLLLSLACGMLWSCKKSEPASIADLTTTSLTSVSANSVQSGGTITNSGGSNITQKGVCWASHTGPSLSDSFTNSGAGSTSFIATIGNLNANTMYYFRAYAINATGTGYGAEVSVTTSKGVPTLTTTAVSGVDQKAATASSGGNITNDGGASVTARGICWSTSHNPTTANSNTSDGTGAGTFTSTLSLLLSQTTYYVRAYTTNSYGTAYGNEVSFTTPSVNTVADTDGNIYPYVVIGTQTWMGANLRTTHYSSGDGITDGSGASYDWYNRITGVFSYPQDSSKYNSTYGKYYDVAAIQDNHNVCPVGWHVPSDGDWETLEFYLGMSASDTGQIGLRGNVGAELLQGGTTGLNLQLGGYLDPGSSSGPATYNLFGSFAFYATSSIFNAGVVGGPNPNYFRAFNVGGPGPVYRAYASYGVSVRCMKN